MLAQRCSPRTAKPATMRRGAGAALVLALTLLAALACAARAEDGVLEQQGCDASEAAGPDACALAGYSEGGAGRKLPDGTLTEALATADPERVLEAVLFPISPTDFRRKIFEREVRFEGRGEAYHGGLLGEVDLDDPDPDAPTSMRSFAKGIVSAAPGFLGGRPPRALEDITFAKDGQLLTVKNEHWPELHPTDLHDQLGKGMSLVINWAQYRSKTVGELALALEAALGFRINVNVYHTPLQEQAFAVHYDTTDVVVLHLHGEKTWSVYAPIIDMPRYRDTQLPKDHLRSAVDRHWFNVTMRPGDILYLPRGTMHVARNEAPGHNAGGGEGAAQGGGGGGVASTHLTVGFTVEFYHTVEAALHVLVMRLWREGMRKRTAAEEHAWGDAEVALNEIVDVQRDPTDGAPVGPPAFLLVHAAIRNAANTPDAAGAALRRAVLVSGKGNTTAASAALRGVCASRPTVADVLAGMDASWDERDANNTSNGYGSVVTVVRDLNELLPGADVDTAQRDLQPLVTLFEHAPRRGGGARAPDDPGAELELSPAEAATAEQAMVLAWAALCERAAELDPREMWAPVMVHLARLWREERRERHSQWGVKLRDHGVELSEAARGLLDKAGKKKSKKKSKKKKKMGKQEL